MRCPSIVGRGDEMAALRRAFEAARSGAGGWVSVVGEAGMGKTRLLEQLAAEVSDRGAMVATGRASLVDRSTPYRPLAQALMGSSRRVPRPLDTTVGPYAAALARFVPHWRGGEAPAALESPAVVGEAFLRVTAWLAGEAPVLVLLEDLHWADADTAAACAHLAAHIGGRRAAVVATYRPEEVDGALARELGAHPVVRLSPLAAADVAEFARRCLSSEPSPARLGRLQAAAGLPLLIEDLLDGAETGATRFADLARARLAGLSDSGREVLVAAALLGEHFASSQLAAAVGGSSRGVAEAAAVGLVVADGDGHRFRHALTHEVVLAACPELRARLAGRVAAALESCGEADARGRAAELWAEAGERARAVALLTRVADDAQRDGAPGASLGALARAVELEPDRARRLALHVERLARLTEHGRVEEAEAIGPELLDSAAHHPPTLLRVRLALARAALAGGSLDRARDHLDHADAIAVGAGSPEAVVLRARLALQSGGGQRTVAEHLAHQAVAAAIGAGRHGLACEALDVAARCARSRSLEESAALVARALGVAEAHELGAWRLRLLNELGTIEMLARADGDRLRRAYDAATAAGAVDVAAGTLVNIAALHAMRGELDEARAIAGRARDAAAGLGLQPLAAAALMMDALTYGFRGQRDAMERSLRAARDLAPEDADLDAFAWGAGRGLCALVREEHDEAEAALGRAARAHVPIGSLDTARAPLLLLRAVSGTASDADRDAARATASPGAGWSDLWLGYAEAVLAGATGEPAAAEAAFSAGDAAGRRHPLFRAIGLRLVAEGALRDGWGDPLHWLREAEAVFVAGGQDRIAAACRSLLRRAGAPVTRRRGADRALPAALLTAGVTAREAGVLELLGERLSNREIADRLFLSPRTVEKHVANLLAKLAVADRAALARVATGR